MICSDGWQCMFAGHGTPLVNFILLKPDGRVLFIKVKDVSGKRKGAKAMKEMHAEVVAELCKEVGLDNGYGWVRTLNWL